MPEISDLPTWISLSSSLLQARPKTTRITTKYTILSSKKLRKRKKIGEKAQTDARPTKPTEGESTASKRRAAFTIKTHDTASGSTLVYKTTKASDLGMLMRSLGGLSADMAGIARSEVTLGMGTAPADTAEVGEDEEASAPAAAASGATAEEGGENKGKAKKKKKGKGKR